MCIALVEPHETALFLSVLGVLIAFSVLFSRQTHRLGIPVVLRVFCAGDARRFRGDRRDRV